MLFAISEQLTMVRCGSSYRELSHRQRLSPSLRQNLRAGPKRTGQRKHHSLLSGTTLKAKRSSVNFFPISAMLDRLFPTGFSLPAGPGLTSRRPQL